MSIIYINPFQFAAAAAYDPDAQSYITAVEAADGQTLEVGVKDAINAFVVGCKSDGIFSALKAACIMAGARTLAGALVPLVGSAPTNYNFVAGDYDRETGLVGDGSTKYLNINYAITTALASDNHVATWLSATPTISGDLFGVVGVQIAQGLIDAYRFRSSSEVYYSNYTANNYIGPSVADSTLCGVSRSASASFVARSDNTSSTITQAVTSNPSVLTPYIFCRNSNGTPQFYTNARIAFYSIGESLDLALLDARVTALINAIGAAIP